MYSNIGILLDVHTVWIWIFGNIANATTKIWWLQIQLPSQASAQFWQQFLQPAMLKENKFLLPLINHLGSCLFTCVPAIDIQHFVLMPSPNLFCYAS